MQDARLIRGLGLTAAMSMNIANMIGTAVFLKARVMTCNAGSPLIVLAVWCAAAVLVMAGALSYAELAASMPKAGGEYVFLREAYGRRWGFLYGWSYLWVSRGGSLSAQAVSTAIFFNIATGADLTRWQLSATAIVAIAITALWNCTAVESTGRSATAMAIFKVMAVGGLALIIFFFTKGDWTNYFLTNNGGTCEGVAANARGGLAGIGAAMLGALWGFQGWANVTTMAGEIRDPNRNIPRAFAGALLIVATVYLLANASYFYAITPTEIASVPLSGSVATIVLGRIFGPTTVRWMAVVMMISSLGALHAGIAATARVPYAMASDGVFFRWFAHLSSAQVPVRSVLLIALWSAVLALTGSYDKLTDWAIFSLWLFYGLSAGALIVLRQRQPLNPPGFRVPGYPVTPVLFILVTALIVINTIYTAPIPTLAGIAVMLLGLPFYLFWQRRSGTV